MDAGACQLESAEPGSGQPVRSAREVGLEVNEPAGAADTGVVPVAGGEDLERDGMAGVGAAVGGRLRSGRGRGRGPDRREGGEHGRSRGAEDHQGV